MPTPQTHPFHMPHASVERVNNEWYRVRTEELGQWLRACTALQRTWVQTLIPTSDSHNCGASSRWSETLSGCCGCLLSWTYIHIIKIGTGSKRFCCYCRVCGTWVVICSKLFFVGTKQQCLWQNLEHCITTQIIPAWQERLSTSQMTPYSTGHHTGLYHAVNHKHKAWTFLALPMCAEPYF